MDGEHRLQFGAAVAGAGVSRIETCSSLRSCWCLITERHSKTRTAETKKLSRAHTLHLCADTVGRSLTPTCMCITVESTTEESACRSKLSLTG